MEATLTGQLGGPQRDLTRRLQRAAALAWWRAGHPGWAIWPVDTEAFMRNAQARARRAGARAACLSPVCTGRPDGQSRQGCQGARRGAGCLTVAGLRATRPGLGGVVFVLECEVARPAIPWAALAHAPPWPGPLRPSAGVRVSHARAIGIAWHRHGLVQGLP